MQDSAHPRPQVAETKGEVHEGDGVVEMASVVSHDSQVQLRGSLGEVNGSLQFI